METVVKKHIGHFLKYVVVRQLGGGTGNDYIYIYIYIMIIYIMIIYIYIYIMIIFYSLFVSSACCCFQY